uniref:uncharacterized protein isoform X2 n=1 Tax=Myxine glutinosa TaxID=7769 RepID=UPI00358E889D
MEFNRNFGEISMGKRLCVICALAALFTSHCFMCRIPINMESITTNIANNLPTDYEIHSWNKTKMCNKEDVRNFLEKALEVIKNFDEKMKNESFIKANISMVKRIVQDFSSRISMESLAQNFCLRFQPSLHQNFFGDLHSIMLNMSLNIPSPQNKCLCFLEFTTSPKSKYGTTKPSTLPTNVPESS